MIKECSYYSPEFKNILEHFALSLKSNQDAERFMNACADLCNFLEKDFLAVNRKDVLAYYKALESGSITTHDGRKYSQQSISVFFSYLSAIGSFTEGAQNEFPIAYTSPFHYLGIQSTSTKMRQKDLLSEAQIGELLSRLHSNTPCYIAASLAFRLSLSTSEIINLKKSDFFIDKNVTPFLTIRDITNPNSEPRFITIPQDLADEIEKYGETVPPTCPTLFYGKGKRPISDRALQLRMQSAFEEAGYGFVTLQKLRQNSAYYMLRQGASKASVAEHMGISERWFNKYDDLLDELQNRPHEGIVVTIKAEKK